MPPDSASVTPPSGKPLPHPSAAVLAARRWVPSLCSAPGRWPLWSGGPCSLSEGPRQTWVKVEATAGHRQTLCPPPRCQGRKARAHSLHTIVLLPGCQDALHQAALLQQLWGRRDAWAQGPARVSLLQLARPQNQSPAGEGVMGPHHLGLAPKPLVFP